MANIAITAANVAPVSDMRVENGYAGVVITAGQVVYYDSTTSSYKLADTDLAGAQSPKGFALNNAAVGQALQVALPGSKIAIGGTLTPGQSYYLSATAGAIAPFADLTTGAKPVLMGVAGSAANLIVAIVESGVTL